jgi:aryl-alcohol dehydrogenase-like predicted oxidoreductase
MEFATIPDTSLNVSRVTLGTWAIGGASWPKVPTKTNVALFSFAHDFMP